MSQPERLPLDGEQEIGFEAEYAVEVPVVCSHCKATLESVRVVRLLRRRVNFVSALPRRGYLVACPQCSAVIPAVVGSGSRLG
jgi:hypothetical protein